MKKKLLSIAAVLAVGSMAFAQTDGEYYLYNESTKTFFSRGSNWGTEASSDRYGIPVVWTSASGTLSTVDWTDVRISTKDGSTVYSDISVNEAQCTWKFTDAGDGSYYWQTSDGAKYVKLDVGSLGNYCHLVTEAASATTWKLLTKAERDAIVAAYPNDNIQNVITASESELTVNNFVSTINGSDYSQVDYTSKIGTARFTGSAGSWTWTQVRNENGQPVYGTDYCEVYQATGTYSQTITGLPQGIYKVTVQGFSRSAAFGVCNDLETKGWRISNDYLKANGEQVQLEPWVAERTEPSNPNSPAEGIAAFNEGKYTNEVYTYVGADGNLDLAIVIPTFKWGRWTLFNNFTLTYYASTAELKALFSSLKAEAGSLKDDAALNTYFKNIVTSALTKAESVNVDGSTPEQLQAAIDDLDASLSSVKAVKPSLESLKNEIAVCQNISTNSTSEVGAKTTFDAAVTTAQSGWEAAKTAESIQTQRTNLENARQTYVQVAYPTNGVTFDMTFLLNDAAVTSNSAWTNGGTASGQQYDGAPDNTYLDKYDGTSDMYQEVALPKGTYKLTAATRAHEEVEVGYIYFNSGRADIYTLGNTGNDLGNGWGWTVVEAGYVADASVKAKIGFYSVCTSGRWAGADNFKLELIGEYNAAGEARQKLEASIKDANALNVTANVGNSAFQIPQDAVTTFTAAIATAQDVYDNESAEASALGDAKTALDNAIETYRNVEFNKPAAGDLFKIVMNATGNEVIDQHAITFVYNETADGNYNLQWLYENNANFAQALTISPVDGKKNTYTLSFVDAEGKTIYIGTEASGGYGDRNDRIRASENPDAAVELEMTYISEGVCHLKNISHGQNLGSTGDNGVFTSNTACNLTIVKAEKATVELAANAGWATLALPFAAEIPAGLKVYSVTAVNNAVIELNDEISLKANTPYIVNVTAEQKVSFSGWGLASSATCTSDFLTGVFANTAAPVGSYVLQNQPDVAGVAFYNVVADAQPTVTANHAYLTLSAAGANVRALLLPGSDATGIETVEAADATVDVYSISGVLVRSGVKKSEALNGLAKGIYIVGGVKRTVK